MSRAQRSAEEDARITREVAERAIRRLDILEWVILTGVAALLLFGVPGGIAWRRARREDRERTQPTMSDESDDV
jgi:hypothetical protein